jgi:hypothetical protein
LACVIDRFVVLTCACLYGKQIQNSDKDFMPGGAVVSFVDERMGWCSRRALPLLTLAFARSPWERAVSNVEDVYRTIGRLGALVAW